MNKHAEWNSYFVASLGVLKKVADNMRDSDPIVKAYIFGGQAVNYWMSGSPYLDLRISLDIDATFSRRLAFPQDVSALVENGDGERIDFDFGFNETYCLLQADYEERAEYIETYGNLHVFVLSPVDLVLSKLARFTEKDREDIRHLIDAGFIAQDDFHILAEDAIKDFVGNPQVLQTTIDIVAGWFPVPEDEDTCDLRP